ncbi:MAG: IS3 family transposase [Cypionkella sp.]
MIDRTHPKLSVGAQCRLLSISRSSFYYVPRGETALNLDLMLLIDKQFLETPFYGVRQMTWHLQNEGHAVNEKRIRRLMRLMPIYQKPNTSRPAKARYLDSIFIEPQWRSLKYDCVYLHAWETGSQAKAGVGRWITFYNHLRPHAIRRENHFASQLIPRINCFCSHPDCFLILLKHGRQPPAMVYFNATKTDQRGQAVA